jgi:hypothetical protein
MKIPITYHGAIVKTESGEIGLIHRGNINHEGNYFVYPLKGDTSTAGTPEYNIIKYF